MQITEAVRERARGDRIRVLRRLVHRLRRVQATPGGELAPILEDSAFDRIYGGQSLAEALMAAAATVPGDRVCGSVQCQFLRLGNPGLPVRIAIEPLRDTRSVSVRWAKVEQQDQPIMTATFSFMVPGEGLTHQWDMPATVPPEGLPSRDEVLLTMYGDDLPLNAGLPWPLDLRHADRHPWEAVPGHGYQRIWMRADETLPDDALLHAGLLLFGSDLTMFEAVIARHGVVWEDVIAGRGLFGATLNHGVWLHSPARLDDWLLHVQESSSAGHGRGFTTGRFFDRSGTLVASAAQEILLRAAK